MLCSLSSPVDTVVSCLIVGGRWFAGIVDSANTWLWWISEYTKQPNVVSVEGRGWREVLSLVRALPHCAVS